MKNNSLINEHAIPVVPTVRMRIMPKVLCVPQIMGAQKMLEESRELAGTNEKDEDS